MGSRPSILIVGDASNVHVRAVGKALEPMGATATVLDLTTIPRTVSVSVGHDAGGSWRAHLRGEAHRSILSPATRAVWWRRPRPYELHGNVESAHRLFAASQLHEAMMGIWSCLDAHWINDPWRDQRASHKLIQMSLAQALGFEVPRTLVTTSPDEARAFLATHDAQSVICKLLAPTEEHCPPTRLVTAEDMKRLDALKSSPVMLQECIRGVDVRVTVIGQEVFAAEIDARNTSSPMDFRYAYDHCRVNLTELEPRDIRLVMTLMERLGLVYGALDFRRDADGRLVFLEVNPAGQWLFVEQRTAQPIAAALARHLCLGERASAHARPPMPRAASSILGAEHRGGGSPGLET